MKFLSFKSTVFMIIASIYSATINARCELLVVEKGPNGLVPLTDQAAEKHGQGISETLLKYQWPTCTGSDLTDQEKEKLLTPYKPFAEEQFVQKKLQEKVGKENLDIGVVFIPTTLYDLFCLHQYYKNDDSMLRKTIRNMGLNQKIELEHILNQTDIKTIKQKVVDAYQEVNAQFVNPEGNALLETNQAFTTFLFDSCPKLADCQDGLTASNIIQENSQQLAQKLVSKLVSINCLDNEYIKKRISAFLLKENKDLIEKVIELEYQARDQNKALLVRGASCKEIGLDDTGFDNNYKVKKMLLGSTIFQHNDIDGKRVKFLDCEPYSISFGSSLFAGIISDETACAYNCLNRKRTGSEESDSAGKIAGYVLFVDKEKYVANRSNQLLFIPPLASIAALFEHGEWFHPRSVAAIKAKKNEKKYVCGIAGKCIKDPAGIILIERNPLEHAALFSKFIAQNGTIIQYGRDLTEEERKIPKKILANQAEAAELYRKMSLAVLQCQEEPA